MRVLGYAGTKWLSETYTWKRAPADLKKCVKGQAAKDAPAPKPAAEAAPATPATPAVTKVSTGEPPAAPASDPPPAPKTVADTKPETAVAKTESAESPAAKATDEAPKAEAAKTKQAKKKEGPNAATMVARIVEAMDDEDAPVTPKPEHTPAKKDCKMQLPYFDMAVTYACDN
jgi:hypothetical protein